MDKFLLYITFFLLLFPLFSLAGEETIPTNEEEPFAFIAAIYHEIVAHIFYGDINMNKGADADHNKFGETSTTPLQIYPDPKTPYEIIATELSFLKIEELTPPIIITPKDNEATNTANKTRIEVPKVKVKTKAKSKTPCSKPSF